MAFCAAHPRQPTTAACSDCARPFCGNCLVQFQGGSCCAECRNRRLARMQGAAQRVDTPFRRQRMALSAAALLLTVLIVPMLAGIVLAILLSPVWPSVACIPGLGGFVLGLGGMTLCSTPLSQLNGRKLREDVTRKLLAQGLARETLERGIFAGISPGETLQSYHGDLHWDIGYLLWPTTATRPNSHSGRTR